MKPFLFLIASAVLLSPQLAAGGRVAPKLQKFIDGIGGIGGGSGGGDGDNSGKDVLVSFASMDPVFNAINSQNFSSMDDLRTALTEAQEAFASQSQAPLQSVLSAQGVDFETFWINNKMSVPNASPGLIQTIASVPGVESVDEDETVSINLPVVEANNITRSRRQNGRNTWGINKIRAPEVWNQNIGGWRVVVACIDTGVRHTHESLRDRWRQDYGWFDPYDRTSQPVDSDTRSGHGTHVMGTIAGEGGIGVAHEATWIACKGLRGSSGSMSNLIRCGQWIQCPTTPSGGNKDCTKAPNVVANSWGSSNQGSTQYDDVIRSWRQSGIIPVFANGNEGPNCNTVGNPGDRPNIISVGSTDSNDGISEFSSLGPSRDDRIKPEISAPGGQILSASGSSDTQYRTLSGTSMACPHVAGLVALMLEKNRNLDFDQIFRAMTSNAETGTLRGGRTCGGKTATQFPNNVYGYGRIDALRTVNAV